LVCFNRFSGLSRMAVGLHSAQQKWLICRSELEHNTILYCQRVNKTDVFSVRTRRWLILNGIFCDLDNAYQDNLYIIHESGVKTISTYFDEYTIFDRERFQTMTMHYNIVLICRYIVPRVVFIWQNRFTYFKIYRFASVNHWQTEQMCWAHIAIVYNSRK